MTTMDLSTMTVLLLAAVVCTLSALWGDDGNGGGGNDHQGRCWPPMLLGSFCPRFAWLVNGTSWWAMIKSFVIGA